MSFNKSTVNPGVERSATSLYARAAQMADPNNVYSLATRDAGISGKFPIQLGSADPRDVKMAIRSDVVGPTGAVAGMGVAEAGPEVFDYLEKKKEEVFYQQFLAYVNNMANLGNPAEAAWWFEKFPMLKEKRLETIKREAEKQKRLAEIQVTGPQNEDDLFLLYMIDQKLITLPSRPLTELYREDKYQPTDFNFKRGLFSPLAYKPNFGGVPDVVKVPEWRNPFKINSGTGTRAPNSGQNIGLIPGIPVGQPFPLGVQGVAGFYPTR